MIERINSVMNTKSFMDDSNSNIFKAKYKFNALKNSI